MTAEVLAKAALLGLLEGVTEFIPVSSTGHLILASHWLGDAGETAKTFDIFIQLGAILAIVWLYRARLARVVMDAGTRPESRRFLLNLLIAFLPAAIVGFLAHDWIKARLFSPEVVAVALLLGGVLILLIERVQPRTRVELVDDVPPPTALGIGLAQVLSLIPGTSRSGATIMGGYALGLSRRAATEFSFFLSIPVMFAATLYDLLKSRGALSVTDAPAFAVGFVVAFLSATIVVKAFLGYVSGHSFAVFAWYRIALGGVLLFLLSVSRAPEMVRLARVGSTMDALHDLAQTGAPPGTAVVAEVQDSGRGSRGRTWASPRGGLWLSVLARPSEGGLELLSLRVGLAVAGVLARMGLGDQLRLKWPNDLMLGERKTGGILCEARWQGATPGVGRDRRRAQRGERPAGGAGRPGHPALDRAAGHRAGGTGRSRDRGHSSARARPGRARARGTRAALPARLAAWPRPRRAGGRHGRRDRGRRVP